MKQITLKKESWDRLLKKIYPKNGSQGILLRLIFCRILVYFVTNKYIKCTRDREALCSASEFRSDSNVRMAAIEKLDNKILNVFSIGDLPAREARYGKSCYRDYVRQQVYENQSVNKENRDNPFDTIDFNSAIKLACDFRREFPLRGRLWSRNLGDKGRRWDQGSARPPAGATSLVPEIKVGDGTRGRRDLLPGRRLWSRR